MVSNGAEVSLPAAVVTAERVGDRGLALFGHIFAVRVFVDFYGIEQVDRDIFNPSPREDLARIGCCVRPAWPDQVLAMLAIVQSDGLHGNVIDGRDDRTEKGRAEWL